MGYILPMADEREQRLEALARVALDMGRATYRALPARVRKNLEDRLFYVIFQSTRVENDAYGWRPKPTPAPTREEDE